MPVLHLTDQTDSWSYLRTEIDSDHFGANLLVTNEKFDDSSSELAYDVDQLDARVLRFPGGTVTEQYFDMTRPNQTSGTFRGETVPTLSLDGFLKTAGRLGVDATIVIPTSVGFEVSAGEALLRQGLYGNREISEQYLEDVAAFVEVALTQAAEEGVAITAFEIGNEFWLGGRMTATEYGRLAAAVANTVQETLGAGSNQPEIIVQAQVAAGLFSPNGGRTVYVTDDYRIYRDPPDGEHSTEVQIPSQGAAPEQNREIIAQINAVPGAGDAIDGVVGHYYQSSGFGDVDTNDNIFYQVRNVWDSMLDRPNNSTELTQNMTEWDVQRGSANGLGLQQAAMLTEMFYEMTSHGVDAAQIWPIKFDNVQGTSATDYDGSGLSIAGEMFCLMSESLIGLTPNFDWSNDALDIHGFSDLVSNTDDGRLVMFASERTGSASGELTLDLGDIDGTGSYFYVLTTLSDGWSGGMDPNAEPVVMTSDGVMLTNDSVTIALEGWATGRLELTYVGDGADTVTGRDGNDIIRGLGGGDKLFGGDGQDVLSGNGGSDTLYGNLGADRLAGGDGDDNLYGGYQDDVLNGNSGSDVLRGSRGNDILYGGDGGDMLFGSTGNDTLKGNRGADTLKGGDGDDQVRGGYGDDVLEGNSGFDTLYGSRGDDLLYGDDGDDTLIGNGGTDTLYGNLGADRLVGGNDDDRVYGGYHDDVLEGNSGSDILRGSRGDDVLFGGTGNDVLYGGTGNDRLTGGDDADRFIFRDGFGQDEVTDFDVSDAGDRIDLSDVSGIRNFDDLKANHLDSVNGHAVIRDGNGDEILLVGVGTSELSADEFIF